VLQGRTGVGGPSILHTCRLAGAVASGVGAAASTARKTGRDPPRRHHPTQTFTPRLERPGALLAPRADVVGVSAFPAEGRPGGGAGPTPASRARASLHGGASSASHRWSPTTNGPSLCRNTPSLPPAPRALRLPSLRRRARLVLRESAPASAPGPARRVRAPASRSRRESVTSDRGDLSTRDYSCSHRAARRRPPLRRRSRV
jgi:hypothetical protein